MRYQCFVNVGANVLFISAATRYLGVLSSEGQRSMLQGAN